ncbi:uncharacterized protein LOC136085461 [Hydra vulgaris]|uniref:Uncharacterized protein LOC136085461 n=1 Tax=Hydra vulgaris TaxID=6087 RepID=A0ABM4CM10_HYDVU
MVLQSAVDALTSLKAFVESKRECFAQYEERAKKLSGSTEYSQAQRRQRNRNVRLNPLDYETGDEVQQSPSDQFRTTNFIPVIDQFNVSLKDRINAYKNVCEYFGFLNGLDEMKPNEIMMSVNNLVKKYKPDLEESLGNKLVRFSALLKLYMDDDDANANVPKELFFYKILNANNFISSFRNVEILLRMYLVLMVSNCSGERSFSKLKLIKNRLKTNMSQNRLSYLTLMSIESDLLREINLSDILKTFVLQKTRKTYISL